MTNIRRALEAAAGTGGDATYVEDVFSTYVYTGNDSTHTITNGVDLDGEGGMVWIKARTGTAIENQVFDTARGVQKRLQTDTDNAEYTSSTLLTAFNSNGFTLSTSAFVNSSSRNYVGWTFRKAPGFFDVVTYTGNSTAGRTISHSLGSVPGCIIVKKTSDTEAWGVYHRSASADPEDGYLRLNDTDAYADNAGYWHDTAPTSTEFTLGGNPVVNTDTETYVAYLFANDDQRFGADEDESIINCGSYTGNGSGTSGGGPAGPQITLGWEPQWLLVKDTSSTNDWFIWDTMRGLPSGVSNSSASLNPNTSDAEVTEYGTAPQATGFQISDNNVAINQSGSTYIYIAIRRPMKVPEAGTEVFTPVAYSGTQASAQDLSFSMVPDVTTTKLRNATENNYIQTRLTGENALQTNEQDGRATSTEFVAEFDAVQKGIRILGIGGTTVGGNNGPATSNYVCEAFRRSPGFLEVCTWAGTGSTQTVSHNLTVVPQMMWVKRTDSNAHWAVYGNNENTKYAVLDTDLAAATGAAYWNSTSPTSSVFTVGTHGDTNGSGNPYCAWLWASVDGVSKVGSYTGTGSDQNIDCGFSSSARFVMLKRWDAAGDWIYLDSARGLTTTPTEPYLRYNTNAVEVTGNDYVRGHVSGFSVIGNQTTSNNSGSTYIFLAIA